MLNTLRMIDPQTGADNGEVKVWNFSSGSCISQLKPASGSRMEVTAVTAVRGSLVRSFLVAGWDRKVSTGAQAGTAMYAQGCWLGPQVKPRVTARQDLGKSNCLLNCFPALTACNDWQSIWH